MVDKYLWKNIIVTVYWIVYWYLLGWDGFEFVPIYNENNNKIILIIYCYCKNV